MEKKVLVETSARHVHVTREALDILFGEDYELTVKKMLSQPGQYASAERVEQRARCRYRTEGQLPGGLHSRSRASREPG